MNSCSDIYCQDSFTTGLNMVVVPALFLMYWKGERAEDHSGSPLSVPRQIGSVLGESLSAAAYERAPPPGFTDYF